MQDTNLQRRHYHFTSFCREGSRLLQSICAHGKATGIKSFLDLLNYPRSVPCLGYKCHEELPYADNSPLFLASRKGAFDT